MTKIKTLDLFCGAGGFSTGFKKTGIYDIIGGVDFEGYMEETYVKNHLKSKFFLCDIQKEVPNEISNLEIDLIIGSPPCQGFSDARGIRYRLDEKNDLVLHYFKWLKHLQPKVAVMENVKGMTTIGKAWKKLGDPTNERSIDFMGFLEKVANDSNYKMSFKILNSYYYGVPQLRERVFCILTRKDLNIEPFIPIPLDHVKQKSKTLDEFLTNDNVRTKTHLERHINPIEKTTVKTAFLGLPEPARFENGKAAKVCDYMEIEKNPTSTIYEQFVFDSNRIYNHVARFAENEVKTIVERIPEGLTYRSDRRGSKHIGVWELFKESLSEKEQNALREISILRTRKNIKTKEGRHTEGFVPFSALMEQFDKDTLENLVSKGFLQHSMYCRVNKESLTKLEEQKGNSKEIISGNANNFAILEKIEKLQENPDYLEKGIPTYKLGIQWNTIDRLSKSEIINLFECDEEYDLTTKAGLRGKYSRLGFNNQSRTLMTGFTNITELVHPKESRGISLREGARLMSFPDSFIFYGSFAQASVQIGNAVAPLVAYELGEGIASHIFSKIK